MARPFRLYDQLRAQALGSSNQSINIQIVASTINRMSTLDPQTMIRHYSIIQAIIYHHAIVESLPRNIKGLSFESRVFEGGKGIKYNMSRLPALLQHIVSLYVLQVTVPPVPQPVPSSPVLHNPEASRVPPVLALTPTRSGNPSILPS